MDKIRVVIDPDIQELIPDFLAGRKEDISKIKELLSSQDFERIRTIGHGLKGSGGGYGFEKITEIGGGIEEAALSKDGGTIEALTEALAHYLDHVEVVFEEV